MEVVSIKGTVSIVGFVMAIYLVCATICTASGMFSDWVWGGSSKDVFDKTRVKEKVSFLDALAFVVKTIVSFIAVIAGFLTFTLPIPWYIQVFTILPLNILLWASIFGLIRGIS